MYDLSLLSQPFLLRKRFRKIDSQRGCELELQLKVLQLFTW